MDVTIVQTLFAMLLFLSMRYMRLIHVLPVAFFLFLLTAFFFNVCQCVCVCHICAGGLGCQTGVVRCPGSEVAGDCIWTELGAESQM